VGAGAEEQGSDCGFGAVEDEGNFGDAEFVDGGEKEGVALGLGEALDFAEDGGDLAGVGEGLVGGYGGRDEGGGELVVHLVGTDAAAAVDGEVPGDADEPDAEISNGGEIVTVGFEVVLEDADEDVLDNVFGLGAVAEDGVGDAEEKRGVGFDEGGEIGLRCCSVRGDQSHVPSPFPLAARRHVSPLQVQTGEWEIRSEYFCARSGAAARLSMLLVRG
jgi:hypothetical protein